MKLPEDHPAIVTRQFYYLLPSSSETFWSIPQRGFLAKSQSAVPLARQSDGLFTLRARIIIDPFKNRINFLRDPSYVRVRNLPFQAMETRVLIE